MLAWVSLIVAAVLEPLWAQAIKQSQGFSKLWPSVFGLGVAMMSLVLLTLAMKSLPAGTAYAAWIGLGTVGVIAVGAVFFDEALTPARLVFLALILIGVTGLSVVDSH